MAEQISLTNNVDLVWMELAANCRIRGKSREEAREVLNSKIGETITSKDNIRKKRDILLNMWYRDDEWFINRSIQAAEGMPTNSRIALHWAQLLRYYPVFYDLTCTVGTLFQYRDEITIKQIRERLFELWGARATLLNSLPKNIQTLKELQAIEPTQEKGKYKKHITIIREPKTVELLSIAVIQRSGQGGLTWEDILQHAALFPFQIENVTQADMAASEKLRLNKMGDRIIIETKDL